MDHLVCFLPGLIALGVDSAPPPVSEERSHALLAGAAGIMQTCYQMYVRHPTGLAPEIVQFTNGGDLQADKRAKHSLLRPETVESLFVMYRVTGNPMYQEWGYVPAQLSMTHCLVHRTSTLLAVGTSSSAW